MRFQGAIVECNQARGFGFIERTAGPVHLERPLLGSRGLRDQLGQEGLAVGRKHVATLMRKMVIEALYRRQNTSRRHPAHPVFPYLLRGLAMERANQVWAADIRTGERGEGRTHLLLLFLRCASLARLA